LLQASGARYIENGGEGQALSDALTRLRLRGAYSSSVLRRLLTHRASPLVLAIVLLALFAGIYVTDYQASMEWYARLVGSEPTFFPNELEAVWELAEHRSIYIAAQPERPGRSVVTLFVDDLDERAPLG
jgi:hypothetical protein